jgi:hypothetical protein
MSGIRNSSGFKRPRRPLLHIGHLQTGRGIHPVGGLHQADQGDSLKLGLQRHGRDPVAHRVDDGAVLRREIARVLTEGLREPAGLGRHRPQFGQHALGLVQPAIPVRLHIGGRQHMGVGVVVVRPDLKPVALQGVTHAGAAGEQVAHHAPVGQAGADRGRDLRQQSPFGADVFDHADP